MTTGRVEAFSDGVIAIIITIMVLELRPPHDATIESLRPLLPVLGSYVMSYTFIGIYWSNHHHLLHAAKHVDGRCLWANLHLLFWLSLIPFVTTWMGENHYDSVPTAVYAFVMLLCAVAFTILVRVILSAQQGANSRLAAALGSDRKGKLSLAIYAAAVPLAFVRPLITDVLLVTVALIWFVPDRRIESRFQGVPEHEPAREVRSRG